MDSLKIQKGNNIDKLSVGAVVAQDYRSAEVFKKLGIDFCCGGAQMVEKACLEAGVSVSELTRMLEESRKKTDTSLHHYNTWTLDFLADYIVNIHHQYVRDSSEILLSTAKKVAGQHGEQHPELWDLLKRLNMMMSELYQHMESEEQDLFPKIKMLSRSELNALDLQDLIDNLHDEHESTGKDIEFLRNVTQQYTLPDDACNAYRFLYEKLQAFEKDLLQHIHLENNILFPKTLEKT